jgi:hypothetical protein
MDDVGVLGRIHELVEEEKQLRAHAGRQGLDEAGRKRLTELEQNLDQCWDLLRQRRAKAEFGGNPDAAQPRPVNEVESYLQ